MDKEQAEHFRRILEKRRAELLETAARAIQDEFKPLDSYRDFVDQASDETERNFTLRLRNREQLLLKKIDAAIQRTKDGTYGICEECGEEIDPLRLEARPVTTLCIECKREQEEMENM
jgi:DnaK suppressor protein